MSSFPTRLNHSDQKSNQKAYTAFIAVLTVSVIALFIPQQAFAQQKDAPAVAPSPLVQDLFLRSMDIRPKRQSTIRLRHVIPSQMASWLSPAEHVILKGAQKPSTKQVVPLPVGIERIVAIDPQNALLVFGTVEAMKELEKLVATLDKPQRQVEIESQLWHIKDLALPPTLGKVVLSAEQEKASFTVVTNEVELALRESLGINGSQLLTAPHVVISENIFYSWKYSVQNPEGAVGPNEKLAMPNIWEKHKPGFYSDMPIIKLPDVDSNFTMPNAYNKRFQNSLAGTSVDLQIAATLNENGTVQLSVMGQSVEGTSNNVLIDGQTLAIYLPQIENLNRDSKTFLLLKPRIVRAAEAPKSTP